MKNDRESLFARKQEALCELTGAQGQLVAIHDSDSPHQWSGQKLLGMWRQAIVIIAVVAALITPTIDPINMAIVMLPLVGLYFLGVGLAYLLYRPREPRSLDGTGWGDDDE